MIQRVKAPLCSPFNRSISSGTILVARRCTFYVSSCGMTRLAMHTLPWSNIPHIYLCEHLSVFESNFETDQDLICLLSRLIGDRLGSMLIPRSLSQVDSFTLFLIVCFHPHPPSLFLYTCLA